MGWRKGAPSCVFVLIRRMTKNHCYVNHSYRTGKTGILPKTQRERTCSPGPAARTPKDTLVAVLHSEPAMSSGTVHAQ